MSRSGQETLPDVWKALSDVRVLGKPSQMSGSGRESLSDIREWSERGSRPLLDIREDGCPGVVGSPSQTSVKSREALPKVLEGSESPLRYP